MIDTLQFITVFCFWLFLALVMGSLCAVGLWVLAVALRTILKGRND